MQDRPLNFRFEISSNPRNHPIVVQFLVGRSKTIFVLPSPPSHYDPSHTRTHTHAHTHTYTHTHTGSQNLWLLANLTEPITVTNRNSFDRNFGSFQGTNNVSLSNLFSFAQPSIRATPNFTELFNTAVENDYTNHMWDQDVTLVIYIFNLTDTVQYKVREQAL